MNSTRLKSKIEKTQLHYGANLTFLALHLGSGGDTCHWVETRCFKYRKVIGDTYINVSKYRRSPYIKLVLGITSDQTSNWAHITLGHTTDRPKCKTVTMHQIWPMYNTGPQVMFGHMSH